MAMPRWLRHNMVHPSEEGDASERGEADSYKFDKPVEVDLTTVNALAVQIAADQIVRDAIEALYAGLGFPGITHESIVGNGANVLTRSQLAMAIAALDAEYNAFRYGEPETMQAMFDEDNRRRKVPLAPRRVQNQS